MKSIVVVSSHHHQNTRKVAARIAEVLGARLVGPGEVESAELAACDLIGFGSGIYSASHDAALLALADSLPRKSGGRAFLFSTDGMPRSLMRDEVTLAKKMRADHTALRERLLARGYEIVGEFNCAGFNTNSFLKLFGGLNRGRPDADDLERAAAFARAMGVRDGAR